MEKKLLESLKEAQAAGEISQSIDIETVASFIVNSWEGALVRAKG